MSMGGLLANALLGGIQGGATAAYQIGEQRREQEARQAEVADERAFQLERDSMAQEKAMALEQMRHLHATEEGNRERQNRMDIAKLQNQNRGSDKLNPYISAQLDGIDNELKSLFKAESEGLDWDEAKQQRKMQLQGMRTFLLGGGMPTLAGGGAGGEGGAGTGADTGADTGGATEPPPARTAPPAATRPPAATGGGLLSPAVQAEHDRQARNNEAMGGMFDRFGSWAGSYNDRSEAEAVWYRRTGNKADPSNSQFLEFAKQHYPDAYRHYTRGVE